MRLKMSTFRRTLRKKTVPKQYPKGTIWSSVKQCPWGYHFGATLLCGAVLVIIKEKRVPLCKKGTVFFLSVLLKVLIFSLIENEPRLWQSAYYHKCGSHFHWDFEYSQRKARIPQGLPKIAKLVYIIPFIIATWKWRILKFSLNLLSHFSHAKLHLIPCNASTFTLDMHREELLKMI